MDPKTLLLRHLHFVSWQLRPIILELIVCWEREDSDEFIKDGLRVLTRSVSAVHVFVLFLSAARMCLFVIFYKKTCMLSFCLMAFVWFDSGTCVLSS